MGSELILFSGPQSLVNAVFVSFLLQRLKVRDQQLTIVLRTISQRIQNRGLKYPMYLPSAALKI